MNCTLMGQNIKLGDLSHFHAQLKACRNHKPTCSPDCTCEVLCLEQFIGMINKAKFRSDMKFTGIFSFKSYKKESCCHSETKWLAFYSFLHFSLIWFCRSICQHDKIKIISSWAILYYYSVPIERNIVTKFILTSLYK